jgi:hypothetical protein
MCSHSMLISGRLQGVMATFWVGNGANSDDNTQRQIDTGHPDGNGHSIERIKSSAASGCGILSESDVLTGEDTNGLWMASAAVQYIISDSNLLIDNNNNV